VRRKEKKKEKEKEDRICKSKRERGEPTLRLIDKLCKVFCLLQDILAVENKDANFSLAYSGDVI
jgi:hypothetical protein